MRTRTLGGRLLFVGLLTAVMLLGAVTVAYAGTGSISGTVLGKGTPLANDAIVNIYYYDSGNFAGSAYTDADGDYSVTGLEDGSYRVQFYADNYNSVHGTRFVTGYYSDGYYWSDATPVVVSGGVETPGIDADLDSGGWITGTITGDGSPTDGDMYVYVYDADTSNYITSRNANSDGTYEISPLPAGDYVLWFGADSYNNSHDTSFVSCYYGDTRVQSNATPVAVALETETPDIDIDLAPGGWITGTVTGDGAALGGGIYIEVTEATGGYISGTYTNGSDAYTVRGLPTGSYKVYFGTWNYNYSEGTHFLSEYYVDQPFWSDATPISVTVGSGATVDADVSTGGSISGTVTGGGVPLDNVYVDVVNLDTGNWAGGTYTDADGKYTVPGLWDGNYRVWFGPSNYNADHGTSYMSEYYNGVQDQESASPVPVEIKTDTPSIDADLVAGGSISGTVTGGGEPLEGIYIELYSPDIGWYGAYTDEFGDYTVTGLPAGDYSVRFQAIWYNMDNGTDFISEYYENVSEMSDATPVPATLGVDTPDIDADLAVGGGITGMVTGGGDPLEDVEVKVWNAESGSFLGSDYTDASGEYHFSALPAGNYVVGFDPWQHNTEYDKGFVTEFYNNVYDWDAASPLVVTSGLETSLDADLEVGGSISGTVVSGGEPLEGVRVYVEPVGGGWSEEDYTEADGTFTVAGLADDEYTVYFDPYLYNDDNDTGLLWEYYNDVRDPDAAAPVSVTLGADTPNINADLEVGGSVSGTVTGDGGPLEDISVWVYDIELDWWVTGTYTAADGTYTIDGLYDGTYAVEFDAGQHNWANGTAFLDEYWENTRDWDLLTPVSVTVGEDTPGIDADLEIGATIGGTVTGDGDAPLGDVDVELYDADGYEVWGTSTDGSGEWTCEGVEPGEYVLAFLPGDHNAYNGTSYGWEYWNDKTSFASANPISLTYGDVILTYDAQLVEVDGAISGTVYEPDGTTPLEDIDVDVYAAMPDGQGVWVGWAETDADGTYTVSGLNSGTYYVEYSDNSYIYKEMLYDGTLSVYEEDYAGYFTAATPVTVVDGTTTPDIDAVMQLPAMLSGWVKDKAGNGIEDIHVTIWWDSGATGWIPVHTHHTDPDGSFDFEGDYCGLYPGTYKVQFHDDEGDLGEAWYLNSATLGGAQTIQVEADGSYELSVQVMPLGGQSTPVYRFYNVTNGTHFYTASAAEADMVIATWPGIYQYEGIAYFTNPASNTQPLYRFYNRVSKTHFYTASAVERDFVIATWPGIFTYEGESYGVSAIAVPGGTPVYRFYNPRSGGHFYTSSLEERNMVIATWPNVFIYEGVAFWLAQ